MTRTTFLKQMCQAVYREAALPIPDPAKVPARTLVHERASRDIDA